MLQNEYTKQTKHVDQDAFDIECAWILPSMWPFTVQQEDCTKTRYQHQEQTMTTCQQLMPSVWWIV